MDPREDMVKPETAGQVESLIPLARPVGFEDSLVPPLPPAHPILLLCESRRQAFADFALFICVFLPIGFGGEFIIGLVYSDILASQFPDKDLLRAAVSRSALYPVIVWRTLTTLAIVSWLTRRRNLSFPSVGLTLRGFWINLLLGIAAFFLIGVGVVFCNMLVQVIFPHLAREFEKNADLIMEAVPRVRPAVFFGISLVIGFYEELIFRGFLMPRLRRATNSWLVAVLFTTVVFAVLHLPDQVAAALFAILSLSLIFSALTVWRRSLVPAVLAHALFNFAIFVNLSYAAGDKWK